MIEFVEYVTKALVDRPQELVVSELTGKSISVFELRCHESDMGKVIGKSGKTISAVRSLLSSVAARQGRQALLEVVE